MNSNISSLYKSAKNEIKKINNLPDYNQILQCMEAIPEYREYQKLNSISNYVEKPHEKYLKEDEKIFYSSYKRDFNYWDQDTVLNSFYKCTKEVYDKNTENNKN